MKQPKIIEITVKAEMPDGTTKTVQLSPDVEAIFFSDTTVKKMLAPFYKSYKAKKKFERTVSEKAFGKSATDIVFGTKTEIDITEDVVNKMWEEKKKGPDINMLSKIPLCTIG